MGSRCVLTKEGLLSMFLQDGSRVSKGLSSRPLVVKVQGIKFLNGEHNLFRCSLTAKSLHITKIKHIQIVHLLKVGNTEQLTRILQMGEDRYHLKHKVLWEHLSAQSYSMKWGAYDYADKQLEIRTY